MTFRVACLLSALSFLFAPPARADETSWNPFLFTTFCSTCGPQTPLTLEQADGIELLLSGAGLVGPAIPLSPPNVSDHDTPPPSGAAGDGKPGLSLLPTAPA